MSAAGAWRTGTAQAIDPAHVAAFAAAVGETRNELLAGEEVPPTYAVTLGWRLQNEVLDGVLPADALGLHGEHAFRYHAPLRPGAAVVPRSRLQSVVPRRSGSTVTALTQLCSAEGSLLVEQLFTIFVVDRQLDPLGAEVAPWPGGSGVPNASTLVEATDVIGAEVPAAYAEAAGDTYAIHLDDAFARGFGLPGVIVHGMCTLAYAARHVRDALGPGMALGALRCRFQAPLLPGTPITTTVRRPASGVGGFETRAAPDEVVLAGAFAAAPA